MTLERTYTVPLRRAFVNTPRHRRTNKAVKTVRAFMQKHMKAERVKIGQHLNRFLWENGIRNPPGRVTVTARKDDEGIVTVELEGKEYLGTVQAEEVKEQDEGLKGKLSALTGKKEE